MCLFRPLWNHSSLWENSIVASLCFASLTSACCRGNYKSTTAHERIRHCADKCSIKLGLCNSFSQGPAGTPQQEIGAVSVLGDKIGNVNSWEHKPGEELAKCTCSPATGQPVALGTPCPRVTALCSSCLVLPAVGTPRCHSPEQWGTSQLTIRVPRPSHPERCSPTLPPFPLPKMSLSQGKAV